jgi:hypothetical protein
MYVRIYLDIKFQIPYTDGLFINYFFKGDEFRMFIIMPFNSLFCKIMF